MVILLTSAVHPSNKTQFLKLTDHNERLLQYRECIRFFLEETKMDKLVLCDNTLVNVENFSDLICLASSRKKKLEILSFGGDVSAVECCGKGYGEGEIVEYAIFNSQLIAKDGFFIKITGRLFLDNVDKICALLNKNRIYINGTTGHNECANTRLYAMSVENYKKYFSILYQSVDDSKQKYLEVVFKQEITDKQIKVYNFPFYPRIRGISGSMGTMYKYNELKCIVKDFLSKMNYYHA